MAAFEYQALDRDGRNKRGVISAENEKAARKELRKQSLTPLKLSTVSSKQKSNTKKIKISNKDNVLITRQMAMLISSGTPVADALASVGHSAKKNNVRKLIADVRSSVVEGESLSDSLAKQGVAFSSLYTAIVAAGESSGALDSVLSRLADYQESSEEMRGKVISALIYPAVLAVVALSVVIALLVFVVPRVVDQFDTMGQDLPFLTNMMVSISSFLQSYGLLLIGLGVGVCFFFGRLLKVEAFKRKVDGFLLKLPIVGEVIRAVAAARFSRTFATLSTSGAPVMDCLLAAKETTPNLVIKEAVLNVIEDVREGGGLSSSIERTGEFPPLVSHMASGGEASGELGMMFDKGAEYLERDFEKASSVALGLLEPLITVLMGGMVMLIILAIMLPILQLNSSALL
jgi:general secretion pathway protein F